MEFRGSKHLILILAFLFAAATIFEYFYLQWHWVESFAQFLFVLIIYAGLYYGRKWGVLSAAAGSAVYSALFFVFLYPSVQLEKSLIIVLGLVRVLYFFSTAFVAAAIYQQFSSEKASPSDEEGQEIDQFVLVDPDTGLYNERFFAKRLAEELYRLTRYQSSFSVALLKLPPRLSLVEEPGLSHILRGIGSVLVKESRFSDVVARYGRDKIGLILPYASKHIVDTPTTRLKMRVNQLLQERYSTILGNDQADFVVYSAPEDLPRIKQLIEDLP